MATGSIQRIVYYFDDDLSSIQMETNLFSLRNG